MQAFFYLILVFISVALKGMPPQKRGMNFLKSSGKTEPCLLWDSVTLQCLSDTGRAAFYPRMIAFKNGSLLLAYASGGAIMIRKKEAGRAWSLPLVAAAGVDGVNRDTPELLELQNGAVLLCYGSRPQKAMQGQAETGKHFDIRVKMSQDAGRSWGFEKVLYRADSLAKNGCWEPAAVQVPSGEIQLFFANEAIYKKSNEQNISLLRSWNNGKTWTRSPQIISFRSGSRDGMPVPVWNKRSQQVILAIEDPGAQNFKPYLIFSQRGGRWPNTVGGGDSARQYALATPLADTIYAGAPYLRQLHSGHTVLSYQSTEGRRLNKDAAARMVVVLGDETFSKFTAPTFPFAVPEGAHALWNSVCVLNDDTIIALTSTTAFSPRRSQVWIIQGHLQQDSVSAENTNAYLP